MEPENQPISITLENAKRFIDKMHESICIRDGRIALANEASAKALGWSLNALIGKPFRDVLDEDRCAELLDAMSNAEPKHGIRASFQRKDGGPFSTECSVFYLQEQPVGMCSVITFSIPESVHEGKMLSFRHLFESNMFGMVYGDIYNRLFEANEAFLDMTGYTREDFISGKIDWRDLTPEEYVPLDEAAIQEIKTHGAFQPYEKQLIRKDGSRVDLLTGGILEEGTSDRIVAFVVNVSARKLAERASLAGEDLFRRMADASNALIWFLGPDLRLHYFNKTFEAFFGCSLEEFPASWEPFLHPDDLSNTQRRFQEAIANNTRYDDLLRARRADGQYRWLLSSGGPVFSKDNEFLGYVGTVIDIHDLKETQAQLIQYASKLEQSNKELEHFATIASHDLQEPLRKVRFFVDHLINLQKLSLPTEAVEDVERIQRATIRMQHLINDLLDLSKITRRGKPFQTMALSPVLREAVAELSYHYKNIHNRVKINGDVTIEADKDQMYQMLIQLLDNALKFHKPGQPSLVQVDIQTWEDKQCRITIRDNGIGMKAEYLDKIFDTFVRLHPGTEYSGTGIGLALVKKIVERHQGSISVESTPGEGSTFYIMLPFHPAEE